jgi:phosphate starvation-inducible PhoH-like protein
VGSEQHLTLGDTMSRAKRKAKYQRQLQQDNTINFNQALKRKHIELHPKSVNQENLITSLLDPQTNITVATGPAGTGKTYLAMLAAIKAFRDGACERIVLTRPAVGVDDEKHGFLPGDLNSKMEPWTRPLFDVLREFYNKKEIARMLDEQTIEISPLAFMRGRTFKDAWIIAD